MWSVNGGVVLRGDRLAFNGYVHVLDEVLQPPAETIARILALDPSLSRFTSLLTRVSCLDELVIFVYCLLCQVVKCCRKLAASTGFSHR